MNTKSESSLDGEEFRRLVDGPSPSTLPELAAWCRACSDYISRHAVRNPRRASISGHIILVAGAINVAKLGNESLSLEIHPNNELDVVLHDQKPQHHLAQLSRIEQWANGKQNSPITDKSQKPRKLMPDNPDVRDLCAELEKNIKRTKKLSERAVAMKFTAGNAKKANSLLRQARRYSHLWELYPKVVDERRLKKAAYLG